jgi:hypothetical protein
VAAPGPSLVAVRHHPIIVVQDAYRMIPWADVLYGCDPKWWRYHDGAFEGEKWSTHDRSKHSANDKTEAHEKWNVHCVTGAHGSTFSLDPSVINYGSNSGFQAINLAILFSCEHIILIGFDMQKTGEKAHFFGDYPENLQTGTEYTEFAKHFDIAAKKLPAHIRIVNATPVSALQCFPKMSLEQALEEQHALHHTTDTRLADTGRISVEGQLQGA